MRKSLLILLFALWSAFATAQEDDMVDYILDDIADAMDEDGRLDETAMEELAELGALADDPLDINSATAEELSQLIFLTDNKIRSIINHKQMVGKIRSVQELTTIRGLTYGDIFKMRHFVYIGEGIDTATIRKNLKIETLGRIGRRWPESRGYIGSDTTASPYTGGHWGQLARVKGEVGKVVGFGMVAENDAGEPQMKDGAGLADFGGWYLSMTPKRGAVRRAVVGHYHLRLGQGLGVWTGFGLSPTTTGISTGRAATGVSPTLSAAESGYLRGGAIELRHKWLRGTAWVSVTEADATKKIDEDGETYVSSFRTSGLHRTETERQYRHNDRVTAMGAHASADVGVARIGVGYNTWHTETPLGSEGKMYLVNRPEGDRINTLSLDARWYIRRVHVFGEAAMQGRDGIGGIVGMEVDAGSGTSVALSIRRFGTNYYAALSQPATHCSTSGGEGGMTMGVTFQPTGKISVSGVVDYWRLRWLKSNIWSPTTGWKARVNADIYPTSRTEAHLSVRHTKDEKTTTNSDGTLRGTLATTHLTRIKATYSVTPNGIFKTTTAAEFTHEGGTADGHGIMAGQDMKVSPEGGKFALSLAAAYFNTTDYACRVFVRQPRMVYDMRFASYSGEGVSASGMVTLGPWAGVKAWAWVAYAWQCGRETVGTGYDETPGGGRFDVKLQVQWKLYWWKKKDYFKNGI